MQDYQPFAISNFRTGFDEAVEPWLLPRDAYQSVVNAHLYRGVLEKVEGYLLYARFSNYNLVSIGTGNGVQTTFNYVMATVPVTNTFYGYGSIIAGTSAETFTYASDGVSPIVNLIGSAGGTGTVNLSTRAVQLIFNTAPANNTPVLFGWYATPSIKTSIMGIKQYFASNGAQEVLVFDQKRVGKVVPFTSPAMIALQGTTQGIEEIPHEYYVSATITGDGVTTVFNGSLTGPIQPGTVQFIGYLASGVPTGGIIVDNGFGGLTGPNVTSGSINYATGAYTITFTVAPASGDYFDATVGVYGDLFTGTFSNFFVLYNYLYYAFFTNNVDPIFYYDGDMVRYLNTNFTSAPVVATAGTPAYTISRCLHVFVLRERLLLIAPVVSGVLQQASIYWSAVGDPFTFDALNFLNASTSQPIRAIGYINTDLIVRFSNSERVFRYIGDAFDPFRFDSTNNVWACDAPYSVINYDSWFSSVGRPAIVGSTGVNVHRADEIIPDFTDPDRITQQLPVPFMNQTSIQQCYGERFDDIKEGWLCYNSQPPSQASATKSDNILAFNYLDNTYAVYAFPFSCLGYGRVILAQTWGNTYTQWQEGSDTWGTYQQTSDSLVDLGGDHYDTVYELNSGNVQTIAGDATQTPTPVLMSVVSKNFNPFVEQGELARLGFIDLLVSADQNTTLRVQFYVNDNLYIDGNGDYQGYYQETMLRFVPTDQMSPVLKQTKVWKRIYVGAVGKFHTIRFYQNLSDFTETDGQPVYLHAMVLYMKPAGRIFN